MFSRLAIELSDCDVSTASGVNLQLTAFGKLPEDSNLLTRPSSSRTSFVGMTVHSDGVILVLIQPARLLHENCAASGVSPTLSDEK